MEFSITKSLEILERTPVVLTHLLSGLSDDWILSTEGAETWSAFDVVGHFIHGEKTDWLPRAEIILSDRPDKTFTPFDRFAQFQESQGKTLDDLLTEFHNLRKTNIEKLKSFQITKEDLSKTGQHPALGTVSLRELLATWVVHDLNHIAQIARVMAKQYKDEVGAFSEYLRILHT